MRNIGVSHIQDFGPCHKVKSQDCCYTTSPSRRETDSVISKNKPSIRLGLSLEKELFVILCSAMQKLYKHYRYTHLSLLITNYLSVYLSIYVFYIYLSIYLTILLVVRQSLTKEYFAWLRATTKLGRPIFSGIIFASTEVTDQITRPKNLCQLWSSSSLYICLRSFEKYPVVVCENKEKNFLP